ncbi:MAG: 50S ribosomal protein L22 [Mariprofundaceae bacterium]
MSAEVRAVAKEIAISPRKARLVADQIRGLTVGRALALLSVSPKKGAQLMDKVLRSAIANAEQNHGLDVDELYVSSARVDEGVVLKRYKPKGMGRMRQRFRRRSHLIVSVREQD